MNTYARTSTFPHLMRPSVLCMLTMHFPHHSYIDEPRSSNSRDLHCPSNSNASSLSNTCAINSLSESIHISPLVDCDALQHTLVESKYMLYLLTSKDRRRKHKDKYDRRQHVTAFLSRRPPYRPFFNSCFQLSLHHTQYEQKHFTNRL